jgi:hypothetical protein
MLRKLEREPARAPEDGAERVSSDEEPDTYVYAGRADVGERAWWTEGPASLMAGRGRPRSAWWHKG